MSISEKEVVNWRKQYSRRMFFGNDLKTNDWITRELLKALGILENLQDKMTPKVWRDDNVGYELSEVIDNLTEILYPTVKQRFDFFKDDTTGETIPLFCPSEEDAK